MSEHRDNPTQADEDSLLRRWYAASSLAEPLPPAELLELGERAHRTRRRRQNLAVAAVAVVAIIAAIAGIGAWANHRGSAIPAAPTGTTASSTPNAPGGFALAEHESILQIHRTTGGGWLLTDSRLLVTDGSEWRACWTASGVFNAPYPQAIVAGRTIRVFAGGTMWTSTDGCATWANNAVPVLVTGAAFPTESVGYIAYVDLSMPNPIAQIYRTDDAGLHWTATQGKVAGVPGPRGSSFNGPLSLAFADADHGWLTDTHTLWSTADGAVTWSQTLLHVPPGVSGKLDSMTSPVIYPNGQAVVTAKYDATPGMDGARGQRVIYRTIDRGTHWTPVKILDDPGMLTISLDTEAVWVALDPSDSATVQISTDLGVTWHATPVRQRWPFTAAWFMSGSLSFADPSHAWLVVQEPFPPCGPTAMPTNVSVECSQAFSPPQHLVATDNGGVTWHQVGS
jgi:hypothetical protein